MDQFLIFVYLLYFIYDLTSSIVDHRDTVYIIQSFQKDDYHEIERSLHWFFADVNERWSHSLQI